MPVYTYKCDHCGIQFDRHQKFSESPLKICPECSENSLRKVFTPVGVVFKGSGFYVTDNRSSSSRSERSEKHSDSTSKEEPSAKASTEDTKTKTETPAPAADKNSE